MTHKQQTQLLRAFVAQAVCLLIFLVCGIIIACQSEETTLGNICVAIGLATIPVSVCMVVRYYKLLDEIEEEERKMK